jgi:hypothetical protein
LPAHSLHEIVHRKPFKCKLSPQRTQRTRRKDKNKNNFSVKAFICD